MAVALPVGVTRGSGRGEAAASGWAGFDVNRDDPVESALAADLRRSAVENVAQSTAKTYTGQWNLFVSWCGSLVVPRSPLPADEATVALYLQSVMNGAKTFAPVKAASAAIAYHQKINLFAHEPTQSPAACLVRSAAMRHFGLNVVNRKEPFEWANVVRFAEAYGVRHQGYCHLVVATMSVVMFGAMCRYNDASRLRWRNVRFEADGSAFELTFEKRKNAQFRQGNKVMVAANPGGSVCPVRLLEQLRGFTGGSPDLFVFRGFNGKLVAANPGKTSPNDKFISYDQLVRFLSLWFSGVMGITVEEFRKLFATQSGRSGCASAAANAGVTMELWGQHGDWKSFEAQKRYMKRDAASLLSVSLAAMRTPPAGADPPLAALPDVRAETASSAAGATPPCAGEEPPIVEGVPLGAFSWS